MPISNDTLCEFIKYQHVTGLSYSKFANRFGMTPWEYDVLKEIYFNKETRSKSNQKFLVETLGLPKQQINKAIKKFEKKKYIKLIQCTKDARIKVIEFTPEGEKFINYLYGIWLNVIKEYLSELSEQKIKTSIENIKRYGEIQVKALKNIDPKLYPEGNLTWFGKEST